MKSRICVTAMAACALHSPALADPADDKVTTLTPSSPWHVDFGEEKCRLARAFGEDENRHVLIMDQGGPHSEFGFSVAGPMFTKFKGASHISVQFGDLEPIKRSRYFHGKIKGTGPALIYSSISFEGVEPSKQDDPEPKVLQRNLQTLLPQLDVDTARQIENVTIRRRKEQIVFNTGNLGDAVEVLNACTRDMLRLWSLDPAQHATMSRLPVWLNAEEIVSRIVKNYPSRALRYGEQGIFSLRVTIEKDGSVSECDLDNATIVKSLQSPACQEMLKARFEPALDKAGEPMRSFYLTGVSYRIPESPK